MSMARYISIISRVPCGPAPTGQSWHTGAQAAVAVGLEWTHAKFIGQESPGNSSVRSV